VAAASAGAAASAVALEPSAGEAESGGALAASAMSVNGPVSGMAAASSPNENCDAAVLLDDEQATTKNKHGTRATEKARTNFFALACSSRTIRISLIGFLDRSDREHEHRREMTLQAP
jgi:hypothetical protein